LDISKIDKTPLLFGLCLALIVGYTVLDYSSYAISDQIFAFDHDGVILSASGMYSDYDRDPGRYIRDSIRDLLFHRSDYWYGKNLQTLVLAVCFQVFGKSLFVYKMSMIWALLGLALAVSVFLFRQTRNELISLVGAMLLLTTPNVIAMSRRYFGFLPLACVTVWALHIHWIYMEGRRMRYLILFGALFYVSTWIHYSAYLYFFIIWVYWFFSADKKFAPVVFILFFVALLLGNGYREDYCLNRFLTDGFPYFDFKGLLRAHAVTIGSRSPWAFMSVMRDLKGYWGPSVFYSFCSVALLYYRIRLKSAQSRPPEEGGRVLGFLSSFVAANFLVLIAVPRTYVGNYTAFYSAGIMLFVLLSWRIIQRSGPKTRFLIWFCLASLTGFHVLAPQHGHSREYNERDYYQELYDLRQLFHYLKQEQPVPPGGPIPVVETGVRIQSDGTLQGIRNHWGLVSYLVDSQAFYNDIRFDWNMYDILPSPGKKWQRKHLGLFDGRRYLFMVVDDERGEGSPVEVVRRETMEGLQKLVDKTKYRKIFDSYRDAVGYRMTERVYLFVFKSRHGRTESGMSPPPGSLPNRFIRDRLRS